MGQGSLRTLLVTQVDPGQPRRCHKSQRRNWDQREASGSVVPGANPERVRQHRRFVQQ